MMQACGPVVRPHEILQTLIISIPQPSAAVKSFFELSRNFGAPFFSLPSAEGLSPPIQRLAAGGEIYARSERGQWPPSAAGGVGDHRQGYAVPTAEGKRGQDTVWFPVPS